MQSDVSSIALGGGSIIEQGGLGVGPASVASELSLRARCFGGDVTVATDVAVVLGRAPEGLGRVEAAKAHLPADRAERLWEIIQVRGPATPIDPSASCALAPPSFPATRCKEFMWLP